MFFVDKMVNGVSMLAVIERTRRDAEKSLQRAETRIRRIFAAAALLEPAGFKTGLSEYTSYGIHLGEVPRELLPVLRRTLGPMRVESKEVKDARKRILTIHLRFKDHPDVSATYEKKLPRKRKGEGDGIRCRIVRNVRVEHVLVCEAFNH
jgi:hypothetical protein